MLPMDEKSKMISIHHTLFLDSFRRMVEGLSGSTMSITPASDYFLNNPELAVAHGIVEYDRGMSFILNA